MNNYTKDDALLELRKLREHLLAVVNTTIDALITRLESGEEITDSVIPLETIHPLYTTPAFFKGTKPAAVMFGDERVSAKKWRAIYTEILRRCRRRPG